MTGAISTRKCYFYTTCLNIISRNSLQHDISGNVNIDFDVRSLNLSGLSECFLLGNRAFPSLFTSEY